MRTQNSVPSFIGELGFRIPFNMASSSKYSYNLCVDEQKTPAPSPKSPSLWTLKPQIGILKEVMIKLCSPNPNPTHSVSTSGSSTILSNAIDFSLSSASQNPEEFTGVCNDGAGEDDSVIIIDYDEDPVLPNNNNAVLNIGAKVYEEQLEKENETLKEFINEILPASEHPQEDVILLYKDRNASLLVALKESEAKLLKCHNLQIENEIKLKGRIAKLENTILEINREHEIKMAQIVRENNELIDEIINSQIEEIQKWRMEFQKECNMKGDGKRGSEELLMDFEVIAIPPCGNDSVPLQLLQKFRELNPTAQGIMALGIGVVVLVVGYSSWPFISWAWPRLSSFATRFEIAAVGAWIYTFINSQAYRDFIRAWEQGKPFTPVLIKQFGPDVVRHITKLAPQLLRLSATTVMKK